MSYDTIALIITRQVYYTYFIVLLDSKLGTYSIQGTDNIGLHVGIIGKVLKRFLRIIKLIFKFEYDIFVGLPFFKNLRRR